MCALYILWSLRTVFLHGACVWILLACCLLGSALAAGQQSGNPPDSAPAGTASQPQAPTQPATPNTKDDPLDLLCMGRDPDWAVEFAPVEARMLGINAPDWRWLGDWNILTTRPGWAWQGHEVNTRANLQATVRPESCKDKKTGTVYPYAADVVFAQGGMRAGCCRKLRPGESRILSTP